jgi:hypothetical protein
MTPVSAFGSLSSQESCSGAGNLAAIGTERRCYDLTREGRKQDRAYGKSVNPAAKKGTVKAPTTATAQ